MQSTTDRESLGELIVVFFLTRVAGRMTSVLIIVAGVSSLNLDVGIIAKVSGAGRAGDAARLRLGSPPIGN